MPHGRIYMGYFLLLILTAAVVISMLVYWAVMQDKKQRQLEESQKQKRQSENAMIEWRRGEIESIRQEQVEALKSLAFSNSKQLALQRSRSLSISEDGITMWQWKDVAMGFVEENKSKLPMRSLPDMPACILIPKSDVFEIIDKIAREKQKEFDYLGQYSNEFSGVDYERFCAKVLRRNGWNIEDTPVSGDQGLDLLASKEDVVVGIQCKRYKAAVGNKAVQEALSGKHYYSTDYAAVVASSLFTKSAEELAGKTGVLLLHHSELCRLLELFQMKTTESGDTKIS